MHVIHPRSSCLHLLKLEDFLIELQEPRHPGQRRQKRRTVPLHEERHDAKVRAALISIDTQPSGQDGLHSSGIDLPMHEEQIAPPLMPHREASRALSHGFALLMGSVMEPDASRAVGGANAPMVGPDARSGSAQARRAGISVAVGDLIHPKSPSGAASGTTRRPSTIGGDAAPLGLGVRGRCAWATKRPALRASRGPLRRGRAIAHGRTDRTSRSRQRTHAVLF
jgi:hypothetical protein